MDTPQLPTMPAAPTPVCATCAKKETELGQPLQRCSKCSSTRYCSRDCQKADWKDHKKTCGKESPITPVEKPFHALYAKTWLHNRPEKDVFKLLIDTYRFRMEDNYSMEGDVDEDSIYAGAASGLPGFRRFLSLATRKTGLLPPWWSSDKRKECEATGIGGQEWSDLSCCIEKHDVVEHYGNPMMPMQLRMFGEQVYGRGPGGQDGAAMMRAQMMAEGGELHATTFSLR